MLKQTPPNREPVGSAHRSNSGRVLLAIWNLLSIQNLQARLTGVFLYTRVRVARLRPVTAVGMIALIALVSLTASLVIRPAQAVATPANTINFQARLETASGSIAADGTYNVQFKLYSAASGGTALWTESYLVNATNGIRTANGYLTANLGTTTAFPSTINWGQQLYLTMNIGGTGSTASWDGEMNPRLSLTSVPSAFALNSYNSTLGYTSSLTVAQPTGGSQTFNVPDQGAAGSYTLLTTNTANNNFIQNQNTSAQATSNFWISGTGKAASSLQSPLFDTPSAATLGIGTTTATAITIGKSGVTTTVAGPLTTTGLATFNGGLTVATGSLFTNGSATLLTPKAISTANGSIGGASTTVDVATTLAITETTAGQTITIPNPTNLAAGRLLYVSNVGSLSFQVGGTTLNSHTTTSLLWDGSAWTSAAVFGASNAYVQNGTGLQSFTSFNIDGSGQIGTTLTVGGLTSLNGGLTVVGATNINTTGSAATTIGGSSSATTVGGTLSVTGVATFNDNVVITNGDNLTVGNGATSLGGTLAVTGASTFSSLLTANAGIAVTGNSTVAGTLTGLTGLTSSGTVTLSGLSTAGIVTNTAAGVLGTVTAIPTVNGGTGFSSYAVGDLLYAATTTSLGKLAAGTSGYCLTTNGTGTAPSWAACRAGAVTALGAVDGSGTPNANGGTIVTNTTGATLYLQSATTGFAGVVNTSAQSFAGSKTFIGGLNVTAVSATTNLTISSGSVVPTADQVVISNASSTGVTTAGVNGLSINYKGGAAAVEAAAARIDLQQGSTSGGVWSGLRIVPNATGAVAGVIENGIKIDNLTTPGAGTENAITLGTGWDNLIQSANFTVTQAGAVTAASFSGSGAGLTNLNASNINTGTLADARLSTNVAKYNDATANFTGVLQQNGSNVCLSSGNCSTVNTTLMNTDQYYKQGGNNMTGITSDYILGSNANYNLTFRTNSTNRLTIDTSGNETLLGTGSYNITGGALQTAGVTRLTNAGLLQNVTYNGNTVGVGYGGTGATTLATNGVLYGNGASAIGATAAGTTGQCLVATTGGAPTFASCAGTGSGVTLQAAYTNSVGGATPEIVLNSTNTSLDVQGYNGQTADLLDLRSYSASGLGALKFGVSTAGAVTQASTLTVQSGGIDVMGGIDNNNGGITAAGALAGVTSIANSGAYTQSGSSVNTFTGASSFTLASGTGLAVTANATIGGTLAVTGAVTAASFNTDIISATAFTFSGANPVISSSVANSNLTVNANGTGTLTLDTTGAGIINLGQNAATINLGGGTGAEATNIANSTGVDTVNIATGGGGDTINIGTGSSGANTLTAGSTNASSTTKVQGGANYMYVNNTGVSINSTSPAGLFNVGSSNQFQVSSTGAVTASTYNGQTISSAANFTGTVTVATSVTTPALNVATAGGTLTTNAGTIQRTAAGTTTIDLKDAATTVLQVRNTGAGVADLNLYNGSLTTGSSGTVRLTNAGVLQNVTYNGNTVGVAYGGTGVTTTAANGQLLIGNGTGYTLGTLTPGTGISISNTAGGITISSTGATGTAGGDLTGTYPNPTIAKLQGSTLTINTPASGNILQFNGTAWVNQTVTGDITISSTGVAAITAGSVTNADLTGGAYTAITAVGTLTGLTVTGTTNINTTGTAATTIGNTGAALTINSTGLKVTSAGAVTAVGVDSGTGLIQGTGGLTVGGAIKFTGLTTAGIVTNTAAGILGTVASIPVANGGTGLTATPTNGQLAIGNGTGYTLAGLTQGSNISITSGVGSITVATVQNPTFTTSVTSPIVNATSSLQLNGANINTAGTLTNVAYLNQANTFSASNTFSAAGTGLAVTNNATIGGTLAVTGVTTLNGGAVVNTGTSNQLSVTSGSSIGTVDQAVIDNTGASSGQTNAGVNNLNLKFKGQTTGAAVENGSLRVDLTPGTVSTGTTNGLRVVGGTAATGVTENALKIDAITGGAGTENAINVGAGWDNILQSPNVQISSAGTVTAVGFTGSGANLTALNGSQITTGTVANARLVGSGALTVTPGTGLTGGGSVALGGTTTVSIANTAVTASTYGSASSVATFSVNSQGQLTAAGNTAIAISGAQVTSGTVADARLSSNVALYNATTANFTGTLQNNGNNVCNFSGNCVYGSNVMFAGDSYFQNGGNTMGGAETLGSNDNYGLTFKTNNTERLAIDTAGNANLLTGGLQVAGTTVLTSARVLQNVSYNGSAVGVAYGGTGVSTFTQYGLLYGNGTSALGVTGAGSTGQCLVSTTGAAPAWGSCAGTGSGATLQAAYNNSVGGSTPEIILDSTHTSLDIQAYSGQTTDLLDLRSYAASGLGTLKFAVSVNGAITAASTLTVQAGGASITGGLNNNSGNITNVGALTGVTGITTTGAYTQSGSGANTLTGATTISNTLAVTAAPVASTTSSLLQLGSPIATGSANGTYIGVNAASSYTGALIDLQVNGLSKLNVNSTGLVNSGGGYATFGTTFATYSSPGVALSNISGYTQNSGSATFKQNAADQLKVTALAAPTTDMVNISNAGFPITIDGTNAQQVDYYANLSNASYQATASRINITNTSSVAGSTTNGVRIVATANVASNTNGLKVDNITSGTGTDNALYLGTGWDNLLSYNGTSLISGTGVVQSAAISGNYANITGVGTITSGVWNGTAISVATGGTGLTGFTANGLLYANSTSSLAQVTGTSGQVLLANASGVPAFTTLSGDVTVGATGLTAITSGAIVNADLATGSFTNITAVGTLTGLTVTGTTNINTTGTAATTIGNTGAALTINSTGLKVTSAGVATGLTGITSSGNILFNQAGTETMKVAATSAPTTDMLNISNAGFPITVDQTNAQQIDYYANLSNAAYQASAERINITNTSSVVGSTTNGIRVAATANVASNTNGIKIDNITSGTGTDSALYLGTGWDSLLSYNGTSLLSGAGILQSAALSGTYSNALTLSNASNSFTGSGAGLTALNGTNVTSGLVAATVGGTGQSSYAVGNMLYASSTTALSKLVIGTTGQCLTVAGGLPTWANCTTGAVTTIGTYATTPTAANGATISGSTISFQSANASLPGMVDTGAQTFGGSKTFANALTAGGATTLNGGLTVNSATALGIIINSGTSIPATDQLFISNTDSTGVTGSGVTGLSVNYKGGAAAIEAAAAEFNLQPGTTSGGIWNALLVNPNATGAATGVTENGLKIGSITTPGAGTENAINVGTGWDNILQSTNVQITQAGAITATSFTGIGANLTALNGTQITTGTVANARLVNSGALTVTPGTGLSGGGSIALGATATLNIANTAVTAGTYGSASSVATFTVNAQGQLTAATTTAISIAATQVSSGTLAVARGGTGLTATPTNGQLTIGNGTGYTLATLTPGVNIAITNGAGSITVATVQNPTFTGITTLSGLPTASATSSLLQLGGAIVAGSASGTYISANAATGYTGDFLMFQTNGTNKFYVNKDGLGVAYGGFGIQTVVFASANNAGVSLQSITSYNQIQGTTPTAVAGGGVTGERDSFSVAAQDGEATTSTTSGVRAGTGYSIVLTAGNGGTASGTASNGWGGSIVLQAGLKGTGTGASGLDGVIRLNPSGRGSVTLGPGTGSLNTTLFVNGKTQIQANAIDGLILDVQNTAGTSVLTSSTFGSDYQLAVTGTASISTSLVVGTLANGVTLSASGISLTGTARNAKVIRVAAEYAGAVLDPSGSNNTGTMTSGITAANRMNYYKWTTTQPSNQNYDVVAQIPIPSDFSAWNGTAPLTISTYSSTTASGTIALTLLDSAGGTATGYASVNVTPGSTNTWTNVTPATTIAGTYTAGDYITVRIRMTSPMGGDIRIGNITLNYLSKY